MDTKKLRKANDLVKLIEVTSKAFYDISQHIESIEEQTEYSDIYNLTISEFSDNSGKRVDLDRHEGNLKILKVVKEELKKQLEEYSTEFTNL